MNEAIRALLAMPDVQALLSAFRDAGASARIVGGAVRDAVMGRPPGDIDIATPALPQDVVALAKRVGWKAVPTGIAHGTVTLVIGRKPYEVTTLRRDIETDGRRALVAFTEDWREDAFRRDFTLNALSLSADGELHDYATGLADAQAGIIRFMGEPELRIREDYLRILRFFRFLASHGSGVPEPTGLLACAGLKRGLAGISRERVRQELLKLLVAPGAPVATMAMTRIGLWADVLPGIDVDVEALRRWTELDGTLPGGCDPVSALSALLPPEASTDRVAQSLRLSRAQAAMLHLMRKHEPLLRRASAHHPLVREAVYRVGSTAFPCALRAAAARGGLRRHVVDAAMTVAAPLLTDPPRNPFASKDAMAMGVPAGPRLGEVLTAAEAAWVAAGLPEDRDAIRRILETAALQN